MSGDSTSEEPASRDRGGADPKTEELRIEQVQRAGRERRQAELAADEPEVEQHERRAERAGYLAEKLEQRARSEREA